ATGVLLRLAADRDLTVVVICHTGKSGDAGPRGHSGLAADATAVLAVVGDGTVKRLRVLKQRDGAPGSDIALRVAEIDGALTVEKVEDAAAKPRRDRPAGLRPDAVLALETLKEMAFKNEGPIALTDWQAAT